MEKKPDYTVINACFDAISPIIKANGTTKENVEQFTYYLMLIAAAMGDEVGMDMNQFRTLALMAWQEGKRKDTNEPTN